MSKQYAESGLVTTTVSPEFEQLCEASYRLGYSAGYLGLASEKEIEVNGKRIRIARSVGSPATEYRAGYQQGQADKAAGAADQFAVVPAEPELVFVDEGFSSYTVWQDGEFLGRTYQNCYTHQWSYRLPGARRGFGDCATRQDAAGLLKLAFDRQHNAFTQGNTAILSKYFTDHPF